MDKNCERQKVFYDEKKEYYFFTWSVPDIFCMDTWNLRTKDFKMANGHFYSSLDVCKDKIKFDITSSISSLKCFISMVTASDTVLLSNTSNTPIRIMATLKPVSWNWQYGLIDISSEDESFHKLKQHMNETSIFICKIVYHARISTESLKTMTCTSMDTFHNLKPLAAALKHSSESLLTEKVSLRVGEDTETVSKVVLCARSAVFAKMFENDMKEIQNNVVTITDIKMPVIRVLVSFMYTGELSIEESDWQPNCKFDFLCDLYYASDKYNVAELRLLCVDLLIPLISMENINRVIKLAFTHNDALLKSATMALIATNIKTWFTTSAWKNLIDEQPKIAAEVIDFFNF